MTNADLIFKETCEKILQEGVETDQRAVWEDGVKAKTKHVFGVVNRYPLSDGEEFPILTLRRTAWKSALDEILWIWQKRSNNIHELNSHIWDSWADSNGYIGKAYGYQLAIPFEWDDGKIMNQVARVFYDLKTNPTSRRIMVTMWNVRDLKDMNLQPCCYEMQFGVIGNKLNGILHQRSQDMLTAGNWNVVQYAILLMLIAKLTGFEAGELVHVIGDCHIYDRHIPLVEEMLSQYSKEPVIIGKDVYFDEFSKYGLDGFQTFTKDMFHIDGYTYQEFDKKIPVAV